MSPASHVLDLLNTTYVTSFALPGSTAARLLSTRATDPKTALPAPQSERWEIVHAEDYLVILSNRKALPRVWLVDRAESVNGVEALRRIRGESQIPFDPRRTALLEVPRSELPLLPGVGLSPDSGARVVKYEPARLIIETTANQPSVLVVSEMWYPGWVATLDGIPTPIHATNFLLRGVVLPPGVHRIEMRYTAPAARVGAMISIFTLLLVIALAIVDIRRQRRNSKPPYRSTKSQQDSKQSRLARLAGLMVQSKRMRSKHQGCGLIYVETKAEVDGPTKGGEEAPRSGIQ